MMHFIVLSIGCLAVVAALWPIALALKFTRFINQEINKQPGISLPKVALIVPCKGLDPDFSSNIQAVFDQNYPGLHLILVTASSDDPAYPVLQDIIHNNPLVDAQLLTAGIADGRSQKVNNQLKGIAAVNVDTEVLVFLDSDARPEPEFLNYLVQPLKDPEIGLATGFRWYLPVKGGPWSILRSAWNGGGVVFLTDSKAAYAWGGAMAIRKTSFDACQVKERWKRALSDDMTISMAVKEKGLRVHFLPQCLVATHEDCTFSQMLEWTNRQTIISKVYHPSLWRKIALAHGLGNSIVVLGIVLLAGQAFSTNSDPIFVAAGVAMLAMVPLEMVSALMLLPSVGKMLPRHTNQLKRLSWKYVLLAPVASMLALVNTFYSLFTNRITWRGVTYEMRSPTSIIIVEEER